MQINGVLSRNTEYFIDKLRKICPDVYPITPKIISVNDEVLISF